MNYVHESPCLSFSAKSQSRVVKARNYEHTHLIVTGLTEVKICLFTSSEALLKKPDFQKPWFALHKKLKCKKTGSHSCHWCY